MIHRHHFADFERPRERPPHHQPVFQNVGNAAWRPRVIFQHQILTGPRITHQIDAGDVNVNVPGNLQPHHLPPEVLTRINQVPRDDLVFQNPLRAVNVLQVQIQRGNALRQSSFDRVPFRTRDDAGHQIERKQPLRPPAVAVHREGDSLHQIREIRQLTPFLEDLERHIGQLLVHRRGPRSGKTVGRDHLIVKVPRVVAREQELTS